MEVMVLAVPGCANAPLMEERLAQACAGRTDVAVSRRIVEDPDGAARWGMAGSPTLLVDGRDPFAVPGGRPAVACRLYRGEDGRLEGAPAVEEIRRALDQARPQAGRHPGEPPA